MVKFFSFVRMKLALAAVLLLWMINLASAECGYFEPLGRLNAQMRIVAFGQAPFGAESAQRIALSVQNVDLAGVRQRLRELNFSAQIHDVEHLIAVAIEYSQTARARDLAALNQSVTALEDMFELICTLYLGNDALNQELRIDQKIHRALREILGDDALKVFLLLFVLSAIIGTIMVLNFVISYGIGLLNHKKFCRIPAQILGGRQVFPGIVTRAGLNGARFEFEDDSIAKRLTRLMESPGFIYFDLQIGDEKMPVFVDKFHTFFTPLYFLEKLSRRDLDAILLQSTRATHNAPAIGHKSNRGKWSTQIKLRKDKVRKTSQRRANSL